MTLYSLSETESDKTIVRLGIRENEAKNRSTLTS